MRIRTETRVPYSRARVYQAYRDQLPEIAAYVPNVRRVDVAERESVKGGVRLHNVWHAKGKIPHVAQTLITPEMLMWDDFAHWRDRQYHCDWELETRFFTDNIRCTGRSAFLAEGRSACRVVLTGDLVITLDGVPGVPRLLKRRIEPQVERFIIAVIAPNLRKVCSSLELFLNEQG